MIDLELLRSVGTTNERLKEIFTASVPADTSSMAEDEVKRRRGDVDLRKRFQDEIQQRLMEQIQFSLQNHPLYSAVDLAWDSQPINKSTYPLMLYAQGKLDIAACSAALAKIPGGNQYVTCDAKGNATSVDLPRFIEVNVNLIRSIITRRLAAQSNKYSNLFPMYKYESRSTGQVGKLRADIMSQLSDIMADQYDYRHHDVQVYRDTFLYGHSVDFPRCAWEREMAWVRDTPAPEFQATPGAPAAPPEDVSKTVPKKSVIVKEGVGWVNPHPTRVFWDNAYPLVSLNTDTGCEYVGFWDVVRYDSVKDNTAYWNRDQLSFSSNTATLFTTYANFFTQYYCTIKPPCTQATAGDLSSSNDIKNTVGIYAGTMGDTAMIIANYYRKLVPKDWGCGDYPYPVWVRLVTAGDNTVIYAELMPSTPACVSSYNENDNRRVNISIAHELMAYQDQMTNLLTYLLLCVQAGNVKILLVDTDVVKDADQIKAFRKHVKGQAFFTETAVLEISRAKLGELGLKPETAVELVETKTAAINIIFQAMAQLVQMAERMMALSPQEQGQPAPREISATETNLIAGTTESVYGFISDAFDEFRAAKKRVIYESYMAMGSADLRVPVIDRYPDNVVKLAGFEIAAGSIEVFNDPTATKRFTVIGSKYKLFHDYIFTSRDGAERSVNTQAANVLVQLLQVLQQPLVAQAIGKEKLYEIVNEIFRLSGAGVDLKLELKEGESNAIGVDPNQQVQQVLQQLTGEVESLSQAVQKIEQFIQQLSQGAQGGQAGGAPAMAPGMMKAA